MKPRRWRMATALALVAVTSCTCGPRRFEASFVARYDAFLTRCTLSFFLDTHPGVDAALARAALLRGLELPEDTTQLAGVDLDDDAVAACGRFLDENAATCHQRIPAAPCLHLTRGTLGSGASCAADPQCASGLCLNSFVTINGSAPPTCGVCRAPGEVCRTAADCLAGQTCGLVVDPTVGVAGGTPRCLPPAVLGEACESRPCAAALSCAAPPDDGFFDVCLRLHAEGEGCADGVACAGDLGCDTLTARCVVLPGVGGDCTGTRRCALGAVPEVVDDDPFVCACVADDGSACGGPLVCADSACPGPDGTCDGAPPAELGAPCDDLADCTAFGLTCVVEADQATGRCLDVRVAAGGEGAPCALAPCARGLGCVGGACAPAGAPGEPRAGAPCSPDDRDPCGPAALSGLFCDVARCAPVVVVEAGAACDPGRLCRGDGVTAACAAGTCVATAGPGEACGDEGCDPLRSALCSDDVCVGGGGAGQPCARPDLGEGCRLFLTCLDGVCVAPDDLPLPQTCVDVPAF